MTPTVIHCQCGAKVSLVNAQPGQRYRCPKCKQPVSVPKSVPNAVPVKSQGNMNPAGVPAQGGLVSHGQHPQHQMPYGGQQPAPYPVQTSSGGGWGLAGFITAMISFVFLLLAPIAFIISLIGLKGPEGRGFAVAGTIISAMQTLLLAAGIVMLFGFGYLTYFIASETYEKGMEYVEEIENTYQTESTKAKLDEAALAIDTETISLNVVLDSEQSEELIKHIRDAWGNPLRVEENSTTLPTYSIYSNGPDQVAGNADDVGESFPVCLPTNFQEAKALLAGQTEPQKQAALIWFAQTDPESLEATAAMRMNVVSRVTPLLAITQHANEAQQVLDLWLKDDQFDRFSSIIMSNAAIDSSIVVDRMVESDRVDMAIRLMNHENDRVRRRVDRLLDDNDVEQSLVISICLEDLNRAPNSRFALERLADIDLDSLSDQSPGPQEIADAIMDAIGARTINSRETRQAVELAIAANQGNSTNQLIRLYELTNQNEVMLIIVEQRDPIAIEYYAERLGVPGRISGDATNILTAIGPAAEEAVLDRLEVNDTSARVFALSVLKEIGTERSIAPITELLNEPGIGSRAQAALDEINARVGATSQ